MTKREFLDIVFALVPNEANAIMDAFDEYVEATNRTGYQWRRGCHMQSAGKATTSLLHVVTGMLRTEVSDG